MSESDNSIFFNSFLGRGLFLTRLRNARFNMKQHLDYGTGWKPDLPDFRDKAMRNAISKMETKSAGNKKNPHTFHAWEIASKLSQATYSDTEKAVFERNTQSDGIKKLWKDVFESKPRNRKSFLTASPTDKRGAFINLTPLMSPIENQEAIGSCTAHAVVGLVEYLQIAQLGRYVDCSRLFLYKTTRNLLHLEGDTGAFIRDTIKSVRLFGLCPEDYWDYDISYYDEEPSSFCFAFAQNYKALRYYRMYNLDEVLNSIWQGYPIAFGFTCFESMFTNVVEESGEIPYPGPYERTDGGHAVLAVGYNASNKEVQGVPAKHIIIRNSWGTQWGKNGYGFIPFDYFEDKEIEFEGIKKVVPRLATDYWTIASMGMEDPGMTSPAPFALGGGNPIQGGCPFMSHKRHRRNGSALKGPIQGAGGGNTVQRGNPLMGGNPLM